MASYARPMAVFGAVATLVLSGCGVLPDSNFGDMNARHLNQDVEGTTFESHLTREYVWLARAAAKKDDNWWDASAYISRARRLSSGEEVLAIDPDTVDYGLGRSDRTDSEDANALWQSVMATITENRGERPLECALAQATYDNWIEEEREGTQTDPAKVRALLSTALELCEGPEEMPMAEPEPVEMAPEPIETRYVVLFEFDVSELDDVAKSQIQAAAEAAEALDEVDEVRVTGHADRSGPEKYNQTLSQARADNVAGALTAEGVEQELLRIFAVGESNLAVPTDDGVRAVLNRRVVIELE